MEFGWMLYCQAKANGQPKGQPRSRSLPHGKGVFDPGTANFWKSLVVKALRDHKPAQPFDEPLRIDVDFYFPRPKQFNKRIKDAYQGKANIPDGPVLFCSKPDRDNSDKAVLDALANDGFMRDDALVCWGTIRKFYCAEGGSPGAQIRVMLWKRKR